MPVIVYSQAFRGQLIDSSAFSTEPDVLSVYSYAVDKVTVQWVASI